MVRSVTTTCRLCPRNGSAMVPCSSGGSTSATATGTAPLTPPAPALVGHGDGPGAHGTIATSITRSTVNGPPLTTETATARAGPSKGPTAPTFYRSTASTPALAPSATAGRSSCHGFRCPTTAALASSTHAQSSNLEEPSLPQRPLRLAMVPEAKRTIPSLEKAAEKAGV